MEQREKLLEITKAQKSKMINRFWYSFVLCSIPLLVMIINILSIWKTNLAGNNPKELVIFIFVLTSICLILLIENMIKNLIGIKELKKLKNEISTSNFDKFVLDHINSYKYFFNPMYKIINKFISDLVGNEVFVRAQNKKTIKYLNFKWILIDFLIIVCSSGLIISELIFYKNISLNNWTIILGIIFSTFGLLFVLSFMIPRQIIINVRYDKYLKGKIEQYDFIFSKPIFVLKFIAEKLED